MRRVIVWACIYLTACDTSDPTPAPIVPQVVAATPTSVTIPSPIVTLEAINAHTTLTAVVRDQNGAVMSGATVTWSSDQPSIATVDATSGLVTATGNGTTTMRARSGSVAGAAPITVAQRATQIARVSGDAQRGVVGAPLSADVVVRALDALGSPVVGTPVTFTIVEGGGTLNRSSAIADGAGLAAARWTLGTSVSGSHRARAALQGAATATIDFTATATADVAASWTKTTGDRQTSPPRIALPIQIAVAVLDRFGNPVSGVDVDFTPDVGSGTASPATMATNANGEARTTWTVAAKSPETLVARARTLSLPALTFTATVSTIQSDTAAGRHPPERSLPPER